MNKITLRMTVNEGSLESFDNFTANKSINNVSSPIGTPTTRNNGRYGKSLAKGYLTFYNGYLGDKDTKLMSEVNKYNGYMFGATDNNGNYSLTLTLNGSNFDRIIIYGDADAEQWATTAIVDGKTIYSDDNIWAIAFEEEKNVHTIEFTEWNKSNYNACITHIDVMLKYLDLDNFWIDNVESTSQSVPAPNEITYGVLANSGGANIRDLDGEFYDYIQDGILPNSNIPVSLFVNGKQVQAHITNDSDYNETDTMLTLQFTNRLADWDTLIYSGRNLTDSMSAYSLLLEVLQTLGFTQVQVDEMLDVNILYGNDNQVGSVKEYLENITIEYPYLESANYRETINKICTLAQLSVYENDNGVIKFISARPVVLQEQVDNAIKVTDTYLAEDLQKNIVLKNKYDEVSVKYLENNYSFVSDRGINVSFFNTTPNPTVVDSKLYYPYDASTFENSYGYDAVNYTGMELVADKITSAEIYNAVYRYKPSKEFIHKDGISISATYSRRISRRIVQYPYPSGAYYLEDFKSENINSSNHYFKREDFNNGFIYDTNNNIVGINPIITIGGSPKLFYSTVLTCYTVLEEDKSFSYYVVMPTHRVPINNILSSTSGVCIQNYSINFSMRSLDFINVSQDENSASTFSISLSSLVDLDIMDVLSNNITTDYANGVSNGTATIFMGDYYNSAGERVLEWEKGEIAQVGQVVYFENDLKPDRTQRYWKITGRTFRWDSSPLVDLQLQEVRVFA